MSGHNAYKLNFMLHQMCFSIRTWSLSTFKKIMFNTVRDMQWSDLVLRFPSLSKQIRWSPYFCFFWQFWRCHKIWSLQLDSDLGLNNIWIYRKPIGYSQLVFYEVQSLHELLLKKLQYERVFRIPQEFVSMYIWIKVANLKKSDCRDRA